MRKVQKRLETLPSGASAKSPSDSNPSSDSTMHPTIPSANTATPPSHSEEVDCQIDPNMPAQQNFRSDQELEDCMISTTPFVQSDSTIWTLHSLQESNSKRAHLLEGSHETEACQILMDRCNAFLETCDKVLLWELSQEHSPELVIERLQRPFLAAIAFDKKSRSEVSPKWPGTWEDFSLLGLELIAVGVSSELYDGPKFDHTAPQLGRYAVSSARHKVNDLTRSAPLEYAKKLQKELEEQHLLKLQKSAPSTFSKHFDPDLAPAEKARVFTNMVKHYARQGYFTSRPELDELNGSYTGAVLCRVYKPLVVPNGVYSQALKFFTQERSLTVAELECHIAHCAEICEFDVSLPDGNGYDPLWHARRGVNIGIFLRNFQTILTQLQSRT